MINFTRRQLAEYAAAELAAGREGVMDQLAAYLVDTGRSKEATLLVRDIETALQGRGVVVADVTSAYGLGEAERSAITKLLEEKYVTKQVYLHELVDPSLLGGIKIRAASEEYDGSLQRKINRLKTVKV